MQHTEEQVQTKASIYKRLKRGARRDIQLLKSELSSPSLPELLDLVGNNSAPIEIRQKAMALLGLTREKVAIPLLVQVIHDEELAWSAAHALIYLNSRSATRTLIKLLRSVTGIEQRTACVYVLWHLCDRRAVSTLLAIAANSVEAIKTRAMAIEALGPMLKRNSVRQSIAALQQDQFVELRYAAVCALSGDMPRSRSLLQASVTDTGVLQRVGSVGELAQNILSAWSYMNGGRTRRK